MNIENSITTRTQHTDKQIKHSALWTHSQPKKQQHQQQQPFLHCIFS